MRRKSSLIDKYITAETGEQALVYENDMLAKYMAPMTVLIAIFNAFFFPLFGIERSSVLSNSVHLIVIAILLWGVNRFIRNATIKTYFIVVLFSLFLAFAVLQYYQLLGPIVWLVASAFIVISIGRNDHKLILAITITLVLLAVYINIKYYGAVKPMNTLVIAFIFSGIFIIAFFIKLVNKRRVTFIREQLYQSNTIARISAQMIDMNVLNAERRIADFLKNYGEHFCVDSVGIFIISADKKFLKYAYEWCTDNAKPALGFMEDIDLTADSWWPGLIEGKKSIFINDVQADPKTTPTAKNAMAALGVKSLMAAPIIVNNAVLGFFVHHTINKIENWRDDQKSMMSVYANFLSDAFSKLEKEKEINLMAYYDLLTKLPNRFLFNNVVDDAILDAAVKNREFAILFIDMDSFKSINDTMGHEGGDKLLQQFGEILSSHLHPFDFAARFGGDEFIVFMKNIDGRDDVNKRAAAIMSAFNQPIRINEQEFFVSASGGIAQYPIDGHDRETLIKNADLAMYSAKNAGKNQFKFCTADMKAEVENRVQLTNLLYKAQENDELLLYYQPQVNINTKEIIGLEALIRWKNPELGMISPGQFIPLAEQTGLINPIGQWVLETACRQNKKWQAMGFPPIRVAVNLSIEQFRNPNLVRMIQDTLESTGLEPKYLELEITESIAIKETKDVVPILSALKAHGITISIDDFGTDYSSLARIKNLPVDRIKMAMEFVHGITVSDKDEAIAMVIIMLANKLGLKVIAEGVETETQLSFLERRICDEVQGYYFYKPMPADDIEALFRQIKTESLTK